MNWENHLIKDLQWSNEIINREAKERVAREIAATAKTGDVIGAGSGSTVYLTLFELAKRIHEEHLSGSDSRLSGNLHDLHTTGHPADHPLGQTPRLDIRRSG